MDRSGILFVISAPSGTGKSSVARALVERVERLEFSVSYTTRRPRNGEADGRDYHFVGEREFRELAAAGGFLEWAEVFGRLYGTGIEATRRKLDAGTDLVLDIDVQGAGQVRRGAVDSVSVMVLPPDYRTLESRLRGRGSDSDDQLGHRLAEARREAEQYIDFDYTVINERLEEAVAGIAAIIEAERRRTARQRRRVETILETFPR